MIHPMPSSRYEKKALNQDSKIKLSVETMVSRNELHTPNIQCRICLENQSEDRTKKMVSPCKCAGSIKYVHEDCLRKWVEASIKDKSYYEQAQICENGMACQMCKEPIKFNIENKIECRSCSEFKDKVGKKVALFIVLLILLLVSFQGIIFASYTVVSKNLSFDNKNGETFELVIAIGGIILLFLFFLVGIYTLTVEFMIKRRHKIGGIEQKNQRVRSEMSRLSVGRSQQVQIVEIE